MPTAEENIATLQRWVDGYPADVKAVQGALFTGDVPDAARPLLVGALNYVLDALDIFPDHYKAIGIADDAMILRLAAAAAAAQGASHGGLSRLAREAVAVADMFPDLAAPLARLIEKLPARTVRGRTTDQILNHKDTRVVFAADLGRELDKHQPQAIESGPLGATGTMSELGRMIRHFLKREGLLG